MRVAIVNDMPVAIEAMKRLLAADPSYQVAWTATDGDSAVRQSVADRPDVILMDLVMPGRSGADATREIMQRAPCAILVVTATVAGNFKLVSEALGHGAYDAVETPSLSGAEPTASKLLSKLANVDRINQRLRIANASFPAAPAKPAYTPSSAAGNALNLPPIVAIGCSTGGPAALEVIFSKLRSPLEASFLVAQHIGEEFALPMVQWLSDRTKLKIKAVRPGDRPELGVIHIAATNDHMVLTRDGSLSYVKQPLDNPFRPSVDVLFGSLADVGCKPRTAVLLTGIGNDGAKGLLRLRQAGCPTIAQDESSCVVYGMPQAAAKLGAAARVLHLNEIATNIEHLVKFSSSK